MEAGFAKNFIEFSFRLPTCLYLREDREFKLGEIVIETRDVIEEEDSRFGRAQNMEVASDIDAAFHFTDLHIFIPDINPTLPTDSLRQVYGGEVVKAANTFIDVFRFVSGRYAIANIQNLESLRSFNMLRHGGKSPRGMTSIGFGPAGAVLRTPPPPMSEEFHNQLQSLIATGGLPLEDHFLMDADRHITLGHPLQALVGAITALDIASRDYSRKKLHWLYKLFGNNDALESLVKEKLTGVMDGDGLSRVVGAIRERNKVVHGGRRVLNGNVKTYLTDIKTAVKLLRPSKPNRN